MPAKAGAMCSKGRAGPRIMRGPWHAKLPCTYDEHTRMATDAALQQTTALLSLTCTDRQGKPSVRKASAEG